RSVEGAGSGHRHVANPDLRRMAAPRRHLHDGRTWRILCATDSTSGEALRDVSLPDDPDDIAPDTAPVRGARTWRPTWTRQAPTSLPTRTARPTAPPRPVSRARTTSRPRSNPQAG